MYKQCMKHCRCEAFELPSIRGTAPMMRHALNLTGRTETVVRFWGLGDLYVATKRFPAK